MRFEYYPQYTNGWYCVKIDSPSKIGDMTQWCLDYPSTHGFYLSRYEYMVEDEFQRREVKTEIQWIKFQSHDDAMMFIMIWG